MTSELTLCLCNFARPQQMHVIIDELLKQTLRPNIFLWDNDPAGTFKDDRVDWQISSSRNAHVSHVPFLWQLANTEYVGRMDDDLHFRDDKVLEDALEVLKTQKQTTTMVGAYGVRVYKDSTYSDGHHISAPKGHLHKLKSVPEVVAVDLLKGRLVLARQDAICRLVVPCPHFHVDLYIAMHLAGNKRLHHKVASCFYDDKLKESRLPDFEVDGLGYADLPDHTEDRDKLTAKWVERCQRDARVKTKPKKEIPI